jgi:hypothetical protein
MAAVFIAEPFAGTVNHSVHQPPPTSAAVPAAVSASPPGTGSGR